MSSFSAWSSADPSAMAYAPKYDGFGGGECWQFLSGPSIQVQGPKVVLSVLLKTGCSTRVEPSVFQTTTWECEITLQDGEPSSAVCGSAAACCISNCDFFHHGPPLATTTKHQFQCILKHVTPRKEKKFFVAFVPNLVPIYKCPSTGFACVLP